MQPKQNHANFLLTLITIHNTQQIVRSIMQQGQVSSVAHLQSVVARTTDAGRSGGCAVFPSFPRWSPAGSLVLFTSACRAAPTSFFRSSVHVVDRAKSFLTLLTAIFLLCCFPSGWYVIDTIFSSTFLLSPSWLSTWVHWCWWFKCNCLLVWD